MSDFGFGQSPFGHGRFGFVDINKDMLFDRTVPERIKQDDVTGDLENLMTVHAEVFDYLLDKVRSLPQQSWPLTSNSSRELSQDITIESQDIIAGSSKAVLSVSESDRDKLFAMWADRTVGTDKLDISDGWTVLIENRERQVTEINYDTGDITVLTSDFLPSLPATLTFYPPDMLSLIGDNVGVFADRLDPPDYTRRALQRHSLISDLKVSKRMFELIGKIYGFEVSAEGLFCISESRYNSMRLTNPTGVFELPSGSGNYYTNIRPSGFFFDFVPLDLFSLDQSEQVDVGPITITASAGEFDPQDIDSPLPGSGLYGLDIQPGDEILFNGQGDQRDVMAKVQVINTSTGDAYWVEHVDRVAGRIWFYALSEPATGTYTVRYHPRFQCFLDYKPAPAYRMTILPGEVLTEPGVSFERLVDRIEGRIDDYIPIHIRLVEKVFQQQGATQTVFSQHEVGGSCSVVDVTSPDVLTGNRFDITPLDDVPLDTGLFVVTTTLVLTP